MPAPKNHIMFTLLYLGREHNMQTFLGEYRDLKTLIQDRLYLEDFGQCGGMGRCATCMVEISGLKNEAAQMKRNEATTLGRMSSGDPDVRLACQIPVDDSLANTLIRILDNS